MLIGRCAWHVLYHGRPRWVGITSWRGFNIRFTDGICARCAERFRDEHRDALARREEADARLTTEGAA
jgi:hypothetical protein